MLFILFVNLEMLVILEKNVQNEFLLVLSPHVYGSETYTYSNISLKLDI